MNDEREHMLISRAVDGEITEQEWRELEAIADRKATVWRDLALSHRDQRGLSRAIGEAGAVAEAVALPSNAAAPFHHVSAAVGDLPSRSHRLTSWSGWAVAALLAIVATVQMNFSAAPVLEHAAPVAQLAGMMKIDSAADAFQAYLDKGQESGEVLGEVPARVLLESRPSQSGDGYELLFLRQVIERAVVPDLFAVTGEDELGRPTLMRYETQSMGNAL